MKTVTAMLRHAIKVRQHHRDAGTMTPAMDNAAGSAISILNANKSARPGPDLDAALALAAKYLEAFEVETRRG